MSHKTDKMLKLALVFFISLLSFSIGTFVGKKYSDNQHKLASLEPHGAAEENSHEANAEHGEAKHGEGEGHEASAKTSKEGDTLLTDHEVAKIAEEFASDATESDSATEKTIKTAESEEKDIKEINPANAPKSKGHAAAKTEETTKHETAKHEAAKPAAHVAAATEKHEEAQHEVAKPAPTARAVASIPPTASLQQYTVQVGSFATAPEAQKMTQDLTNKGYKASFVTAQVNGQTWHRVQVGLFGSVNEAQNYKKEFLEKTHLTSAIVQRVQK